MTNAACFRSCHVGDRCRTLLWPAQKSTIIVRVMFIGRTKHYGTTATDTAETRKKKNTVVRKLWRYGHSTQELEETRDGAGVNVIPTTSARVHGVNIYHHGTNKETVKTRLENSVAVLTESTQGKH